MFLQVTVLTLCYYVHCTDVNILTLVLILSLLVALITQLQFCCSCPDVLLVSALRLYRRGYGFESRLSVNLFLGFNWIATYVVRWSIMSSYLKNWGLAYSDIAIPWVPEGFFTGFAIRKKLLWRPRGNLAMETKKTDDLLATRFERRLAVIELFLPLIRARNDCWSEQLYQIEIGHRGEKLQSFQFLPEEVNFPRSASSASS